jgi:hypothetical protein
MHNINSLKTQLNPICHLLALLGAHHILHVSRIRVNLKYHDLYTSSLSTARNMHNINPLKTQLNPICHMVALLGAHHILHVSRIRVNSKYHNLHTSALSTARNMHNINVKQNTLLIMYMHIRDTCLV